MRHFTPPVRAWTSVLALATALTAAAALPATSAPPSDGAAATKAIPLFGTTVFENRGESYGAAYRRVSSQYGGKLDVVRMFFPKLPASWANIQADVGSTPLVVSFRADPAAVIAGRYDSELRQWFAQAPTGRTTWWSYWHEPENDSVSTTQYRKAWAHIRGLADSARNSQLRATLILMCWTLDSKSGRNWRNYYAGDNVIQVLAFDCYNTGRKNGVYRDPAKILAPVQATAASVGKPWGIAELGSTVVNSDGGEQGRAAWLRAYADQVQQRGGLFATYFDSSVGFDYRLLDQASRNAWKSVVQR
jgi:hypothetical protein